MFLVGQLLMELPCKDRFWLAFYCRDEGVGLASVSRVENLTFRGHVLQHRDIPLARAIAVSPWLDGQGSALPCFGFVHFRWFFV